MKTRTFDLLGKLASFAKAFAGTLTTHRLPRHVAEEERLLRGEPVDRDATTLLRHAANWSTAQPASFARGDRRDL
jgi:hypothetical protein